MPASTEALSLPPSAAIRYFRDKLDVPTERWTDLWKDAHVRAFSVAGATSAALLTDLRGAVLKGLEQGTTLQEFRQDFDAIVDKHGWAHTGTRARRARLIYQTNLNMALAAGRYAEMTEPATLALYPYWQYVHSGSRHPRLQHLAWNGMILRADDAFWATHYPPNGWHCGCQVRVVSEGDMRRMGRTGPDPSPQISYRGWRNPRTGQVERVPVGIDPGFDYNPGAVWTTPVPRPSPAVTPPARPAPPPRPTAPTVVPYPFASPGAARSELLEASRPWARTLSADERAALERWKQGGADRIQRTAAGDTEDAAAARDAVALQAALARAVAPRALELHHTVTAAELEQLRGRPQGSVARAPTFRPATLAPIAGESGVRVLVPQGMPGVGYIEPWPVPGGDAAEILLNREMAFRVFAEGEAIALEATQDDTE